MSSNQEEHEFINRPSRKGYHVEYKAPPPAQNPVVRGVALHYLANLVAWSGFIQGILWSNAGFGALRDRDELDQVDPRYEPTVIKTNNQPIASNEEYLSALASEDWKSKRHPKAVFTSSLDYHEAYKSGNLTPLDVVETLLPLVRRDVREATKHSIAFLSTRADLVRKAAEESTARYKSGKPLGPIDGVPMAVKDEEDLTGYTKCLSSKLDFTNKDDVTSYCVQKWLDAGAICIGKTTMHELGMDTTNNNPIWGTPRNPNCESYYCGGSSGGSAYAVAAGLMPFAMGNDGGGSIRIPAGYCGLYGLKPSHGRVSIRPSSNLAKSTGVPGPIAATMLDLELAYRVMAQPDALSAESSKFIAPSPSPSNRNKILGIHKTWFDRADEPVHTLCQNAIDYLTTHLGYSVVDIDIPLVHDGQLAHAMTILSEIASGIPSVSALTAPNKILLTIAKKTPGVDFLQAQKLRNLLMSHLAYLFDKHPGLIIVTPTTPNAGWKINEGDLKYGCSDGNMQIRNMEFAWMANFVGCPGIGCPVGYVDPAGAKSGGKSEGKVPVGMIGMGEWCSEDELIAFGYDVEKYLREGYEEGRNRPETFVDVLNLAGGS